MTDKSSAQETDIYYCLNKYGATTLLNKTINEQFMYLDNTNRNLTLDEAVHQREQLNEYFINMPAKCRKVFGDNFDNFVEKYKSGDLNDFLKTGTLSQEQVNKILTDEKQIESKKIIYRKLNKLVKKKNIILYHIDI